MQLLRDALELLASPAGVQLQHPRSLGVPDGIDELALEYDDVVATADSMLKEGEHFGVRRLCLPRAPEGRRFYSRDPTTH